MKLKDMIEEEFKDHGKSNSSTSNQSVSEEIIPHETIEEVTTPEHSAILELIIKDFREIDYAEEANLDDPSKLQTKHIVVTTIEKILEQAKLKNLDLCISDGYFYAFNGQFWDALSREYIKHFLGRVAEKAGVSKFTARYYSFKGKLFQQMLSEAQLIKPYENNSVVLVNLKNGTLEISPEGTTFREFRSSDFLKYRLPFDYNPNATAPMFTEAFNMVLPNTVCQMVLFEAIAYAFVRTSFLKLEKAIVLYGSGANGKSFIYDLTNALLGPANISNYSLDNLLDSKGYHRAMLVNKLINYSSEMNGNIEADMFKQLASGEEVECRQIYCQPTTISNYAKLFFNTNTLPKGGLENSPAFFRRFKIIPFNITIPEEKQDKRLAQKIIASGELSGIFNCVLEGLHRLLKNEGYTESDEINAELTKYKTESDNVKLFLDDANYVESVDHYISVKQLSNLYTEFCKEGRYRPLNHLNFVKRLRALEVRIEKRNTGLVAFVESKLPQENPNNKLFDL